MDRSTPPPQPRHPSPDTAPVSESVDWNDLSPMRLYQDAYRDGPGLPTLTPEQERSFLESIWTQAIDLADSVARLKISQAPPFQAARDLHTQGLEKQQDDVSRRLEETLRENPRYALTALVSINQMREGAVVTPIDTSNANVGVTKTPAGNAKHRESIKRGWLVTEDGRLHVRESKERYARRLEVQAGENAAIRAAQDNQDAVTERRRRLLSASLGERAMHGARLQGAKVDYIEKLLARAYGESIGGDVSEEDGIKDIVAQLRIPSELERQIPGIERNTYSIIDKLFSPSVTDEDWKTSIDHINTLTDFINRAEAEYNSSTNNRSPLESARFADLRANVTRLLVMSRFNLHLSREQAGLPVHAESMYDNNGQPVGYTIREANGRFVTVYNDCSYMVLQDPITSSKRLNPDGSLWSPQQPPQPTT